MKPDFKKPFALYVHWPYCLSKCPYCDFFSLPQKRIDEKKLLDAYRRDIALFQTDTPVTSIFFGGGTPSLMSIPFFIDLMKVITDTFSIAPNTEITLEANPDAISPDKMDAFAAGGINRLSVGVQSLNPTVLKTLGRTHSVETALTCLKNARAVFPRVSVDLIYARPHQTSDSWQSELEQALAQGLTHYSLYQLTIEDGTVFKKRGIQPASEERAVELYQQTNTMMTAAGCPPYEISNYAAVGDECRHNLAYWLGSDYIGIGPAAHGRLKNGTVATSAPRSVHAWIENGIYSETLTPEQQLTERLIMGLRLYNFDFPTTGLSETALQNATDIGWITKTGTTLRVTDAGRLVLDQLILSLIP